MLGYCISSNDDARIYRHLCILLTDRVIKFEQDRWYLTDKVSALKKAKQYMITKLETLNKTIMDIEEEEEEEEEEVNTEACEIEEDCIIFFLIRN